jgi:ABC-type amino acid transport substrate-binding protein
LLGALDRGELDATLIDLRRLDAYRVAHPNSAIKGSGYFYPIGVNRGFVGLASDPALLVEVNKVLSDLQEKGAVAEFARSAGLTFLPPREPAILGDAMMKAIQN